jgi:hypothetical protein
MMPISPWFYTDLPGFDKNWLWRGDDLWFDRWEQAMSLSTPPEWIEILTWNDYGESHHIGPLHDEVCLSILNCFCSGRLPDSLSNTPTFLAAPATVLPVRRFLTMQTTCRMMDGASFCRL